MQNNLVFIPSFSLEPNKLVSYNSLYYKSSVIENSTSLLSNIHDMRKVNKRYSNNKQVKRKHHNWTLSANGYRTLKRRINWLYYLSKSRHVKTYNGKDIFNFRMCFLTLTLPSKQNEPTIELNKKLINPFLTEIKQRTKMENYVFKLEFQNNGNAHWHFVTDTYLDYFLVLKIWNRLLKKHGYIKPYSEKMNKLKLSDYVKMRNKHSEVDYSTCVKAYAKGKRENWEQPNSVDLKSVTSEGSISYYISKYFGKGFDIKCACNENDTPENSSSIRLWFSSRSLSKLNSISNFCEAVTYDIFSIVSHAKEYRKFLTDYAVVILFEIKSMAGNARKWIEILLKDYSKKQGYIPAA